MRGQPRDYDGWADEIGDEQWSYDALLPYFTAMEDNARLNDEYHGVGGPWQVSDLEHMCELRAFVLAAQGLGLPHNGDFNGRRSQRGVGAYQVTTRGGRRCSAVEVFLRPGRAGGRLDVKTSCLVHSLIIENGRAVGVRYSQGDGRNVAEARRDGGAARRRRHRDAEAPDALRHRPGGAPEGARHSRPRRSFGRRRQSPGPYRDAGRRAVQRPLRLLWWP